MTPPPAATFVSVPRRIIRPALSVQIRRQSFIRSRRRMDDWVIYVVDKPEPVAVPVMDKRPESRPCRDTNVRDRGDAAKAIASATLHMNRFSFRCRTYQ